MTVSENIEKQYQELRKTCPIVDTHNDFPYLLRLQLHNELHTDNNRFNFDEYLTSHTDLKRMKEGGLGIQFFSCFIECKNDDELYDDFNIPNSAVRDTLEQIDVTKRLVNEYSNQLKFVTNADDAMRNFLETKGEKISITLGIEGLHQCDLSLAVVRLYFELGVRYITLTHNCDNPFATAASSVRAGKPDLGLTEFGVDCIKEMNRLGMIVDLSHVSHKTMVDTLNVAQSPVIFSHSSVYSINNHLRNVQDDVLLMVKKNGGVVCINFLPDFIQKKGQDTEDVSIDTAVEHIEYIINLIGWDHVGFGSDFDGIPKGPKGLEDVSKYPDLIKKVWEKTQATPEQISKIMGLNIVRVWKECELVASKLSNKLPVESNWDKRRWEFQRYCLDFPELYPGAFKIKEKQNTYLDSQILIKKVDQ